MDASAPSGIKRTLVQRQRAAYTELHRRDTRGLDIGPSVPTIG